MSEKEFAEFLGELVAKATALGIDNDTLADYITDTLFDKIEGGDESKAEEIFNLFVLDPMLATLGGTSCSKSSLEDTRKFFVEVFSEGLRKASEVVSATKH